MTLDDQPIGEDDLQAYIDDRLAPDRRRRVEAWLQQHPERRRNVEADRRHRDTLRSTLLAGDEPVPARLRVAEIRRRLRAARSHRVRAAAAAVVLVIGGAAVGWSGRGWLERQAVADMSDAVAAYRVFTADAAQPVEMRASDRARLGQWLSGRLGRTLEIPDLSSLGLRFMGGRLLSTADGAAALLMYDNDRGARLVFYVRPVAGGRPPGPQERIEGGIATRFWFDGRYGYAVAGPAASPVLRPAAEAFQRAYAAT
jgi:anti-sigma factor RsiW